MKRFAAMALVMCLLGIGCAAAEIRPPEGVDLTYKSWTGVEALRAVVLCESLSVRVSPSDSAEIAHTLRNGETFLTWETKDGWLNAYYSDGFEAGWVRADYAIINPPYYVAEKDTPAYAYGETGAPRVALINRNDELPIIHETEDYYIVALRGASAWIRKADTK